ncbi:MAG: hypothetical protein OEZ58_19970 [Gammaproteobacteria bacterium]|nr:hypothetical protein [Gammaproteobacteria bacterium]
MAELALLNRSITNKLTNDPEVAPIPKPQNKSAQSDLNNKFPSGNRIMPNKTKRIASAKTHKAMDKQIGRRYLARKVK